jgi:putative acetyltransferase
MIRIRAERPGEADAVRAIHLAASPTWMAAALVDRLRDDGDALISLIAEADGEFFGHVLFSPVTLDPPAKPIAGAALAPVAVLPAHRGRHLGSRLVLAGLESCREADVDFVVVLGDPVFYSRFGFRSAQRVGLDDPWNGGVAFQAVELKSGCLSGYRGLVRYPPAFENLGTAGATAA